MDASYDVEFISLFVWAVVRRKEGTGSWLLVENHDQTSRVERSGKDGGELCCCVEGVSLSLMTFF